MRRIGTGWMVLWALLVFGLAGCSGPGGWGIEAVKGVREAGAVGGRGDAGAERGEGEAGADGGRGDAGADGGRGDAGAERGAGDAVGPETAGAHKEAKPGKMYSMQIGHSQPVDNPRHQSFLLFKELLEERTGGGIQVEIYPAGQLGSEAFMLAQVCDGTIQGFRGGQLEIVPKMLIFSLPFLCENRMEVERLVKSDFAREIAMDSRASGAAILGIGDAGGFRQFSNSVRLIRRPEDLRGLKMRSNGMDTVNRTLEALGAQVLIVPYNDLYMALKAGVVDGQENPWVNSSGMRFYEVQKFFTEVNYQFHPEPFYVNTEWYESLPEEYQEILLECTEAMMQENNRLIDENEVEAMENIRANAQVYTLSGEERQAFVEAAEVVYQEYMDRGLLTAGELERMRRIIRGEEE